jgi:hypothetical protein
MRLKRTLRHWQHGTAATVAWLLGSGAGLAWGQSVDTSMARAVVDQPLSMTVLVRAFDVPGSRITPDCLQVRLQQGESGEAITPLRLRTVPSGEDGRVAVHISSPQPVTDTVLLGQLSLQCGADYHRDFTVLVDPPAAAGSAARPARTIQAARPAGPPSHPATTPPSSITRSVPWNDDEQHQRLVSAIVAALVPLHVARPASSPAADNVPAVAHHPWQDLREEQRLTRASLAALTARLERTEREGWRDALLVLGTVLGLSIALLVARLVREGLLPRLETRPPAPHTRRGTDDVGFSASAAASAPTTPALHAASVPPNADHPSTVDWIPPETPTTDEIRTRTRWPDADFGHPSLDSTTASRELLQELEPHVGDSPVGVAVVLEQRLQALPGKCPWILLRLLALYQHMGQPWNHERVAAQLQTLYNVRIPDMGEAAAVGLDLDAYPDTLERIVQSWPQDTAEETVNGLLLQPTIVEVLDLPAFETALLLHDLLRQRRNLWRTAVDGSALPPPCPGPSTVQGHDRLMELLAA